MNFKKNPDAGLANYVKGVLAYSQARRHFNGSTRRFPAIIPMGAGMSSSALECRHSR